MTLSLAGVIGGSLPFLFFIDEDFAKEGEPLPTKRKVLRCPLEDLEDRDIQLKGQDEKSPFDRASVETLVADVIKDTGSRETVKIVIGLDTDQDFAETSLRFIPSASST